MATWQLRNVLQRFGLSRQHFSRCKRPQYGHNVTLLHNPNIRSLLLGSLHFTSCCSSLSSANNHLYIITIATDMNSAIPRLWGNLWTNINLNLRGKSDKITLFVCQMGLQSMQFQFFRLPWQHFPILMSFCSSPTKRLSLWKL